MLQMGPLFEKIFFKNEESTKLYEQLAPMFKADFEEVTPETVYKEGKPEARKIFNQLLRPFVLEKSRIIHPQHLKELYDLSQQGKACLLLPEHYGNFDLSNICYLTDNDPQIGEGFANSLVAVAGAKLSLDNANIATFAQIYNRVVIFPSRGIESITDEKKREEERKKTLPINLASIKEITRRKYQNQMFLVFPSGTRIRPWKEETKTGVPEIYNYLRIFEYCCLMSVNGNNLPINPDESTMTEDIPTPEHIYLGVSPVMRTEDLIRECSENMPADIDPKAYIVTNMMKRLFVLHEETEAIRSKEIS